MPSPENPRHKATVARVDKLLGHAPPVLALHGFTLGGAMFKELDQLMDVPFVTWDLPGHGGRDATDTSWEAAVGEVLEKVRAWEPSTVLGYSMGGRLALAAALQEPDLFQRLVLVSTSVGIEDSDERAERRRRDEETADAIEATGNAEDFLRQFGETPFLQAPGSSIELEAIRLSNSADGIVGALRGMGQGAQPYLGAELATLDIPIVWIAGVRDEKYKAIAKQAAAACRRGRAVLALAAHNVIAEDPAAVAAVVMAG